ncbi:DUF4340 domain-containing protein [Sphaerospermopsis aphanizomenoides BCCUSP55]|uniref:DUF4340 domain-containing protein n=1 Tax=Sphaerospermopsis aphanizomenoides TaxID=459663 RepID=UPI001907D282|nr:DUF4340 domain-containing protein [Sphaerospermopsis aphanizomenoides]MBK1986854.1 DUF4340 domain-containing protein [Sphaerospermopsis aphanizomenoides BCCUSP55]
MKRTTLILILLALGLGAFVYFHEIKGSTQREAVKQSQQKIFAFTADDVQSLTVRTKDITLNLERSPKPEPPKWLIKSPISEPANDAIVSYLMDLLVQGKSERNLSIPANQLSEFGVDNPQATIDIQLKNQQSHKLILGKPNFNDSFLYAQVDPTQNNNDNINVLLVSKDFANAVNLQLSEWKEVGKNSESQPLPGLPEAIPTTIPTATPTTTPITPTTPTATPTNSKKMINK